jgi:hypothetical protein
MLIETLYNSRLELYKVFSQIRIWIVVLKFDCKNVLVS